MNKANFATSNMSAPSSVRSLSGQSTDPQPYVFMAAPVYVGSVPDSCTTSRPALDQDEGLATPAKPRIVIVDDHDLVREGLAALLETHWDVCGEAGNGIEAIEKVRELKPDMVLLDLSMPIMSGTQAAKSIRAISPRTKIVFLSMHDSPTVAALVRTIGAAGFISKHATAKDFREALAALLGHVQ